MTTEEYLQNSLGLSHFYHDRYEKMCCLSDEVQKAMVGFASIKVVEALEIAAKKAKTKTIEGYSGNTGSEYSNDYDVVDKDSILNAINLNEFIQ